jgi:glycosyltransferase involved in cell wall biosynthesis
MTTGRPRILMLTTQLGYGGAETSFIRLANLLAESMEVTVALFTSNYGIKSYAAGHVPLQATVELLDDTSQTVGRVARWWKRVKRVRALKKSHDVTISFLSGPNLVNALSGNLRHSIVSLRGSRVYDPVAPWLQRWSFRHVLDRITYWCAGTIVPVSPGLMHELPCGARKVVPIPPFIDRLALTQALAMPLPANYEALRGQKIVVAVGRLSVEKGFQHLIRVVGALAKQRVGVKLLLVGDGPMQEALREACSGHGLAVDDFSPEVSSVIFAGYQQNVAPLMQLGCVYALTSATEGFPSVLLEAMVANVPVVAADTPWGARAILDEYAVGASSPYPTAQPKHTPYGLLMPRIDLLHYEAHWVEALAAYVDGSQPLQPLAAGRPDFFSTMRVNEQWKALIAQVMAA